MYEPRPRLFAGGDPRDRQTGGDSWAAAAVVILAFTGGAASLFSLFVLPYASDQCGDPDRYLVCTAIGQNFVVGGPVVAMMLGTVIAAISLTLHPRYRALGIALGYLICFGTFLAALIIAFAP